MVTGSRLRVGLLPPSVADCTALTGEAGSQEGEYGVGNIAREASGNKIT